MGHWARMETLQLKCQPFLFILGLAALLDRQALVPAVPEVHLVNDANQIDNLVLEPGNSLSERVLKHHC